MQIKKKPNGFPRIPEWKFHEMPLYCILLAIKLVVVHTEWNENSSESYLLCGIRNVHHLYNIFVSGEGIVQVIRNYMQYYIIEEMIYRSGTERNWIKPQVGPKPRGRKIVIGFVTYTRIRYYTQRTYVLLYYV